MKKLSLYLSRSCVCLLLLLMSAPAWPDEDRERRDFTLPRLTFQPETRFFVGKIDHRSNPYYEDASVFLRLSRQGNAASSSLIGSYFVFQPTPCEITPIQVNGNFVDGSLQLSVVEFDPIDNRISTKPTFSLSGLTSWDEVSSASALTGYWGSGSKKSKADFRSVQCRLPDGLSSTTRRVQQDFQATKTYFDVSYPVLLPSYEPVTSLFNSGLNRWLSPHWDAKDLNQFVDDSKRREAYYNTAACDFSFVSPQVVSAVLQVENYAGGNGNRNSTQTRTFDFRRQRFLNLTDIFLPTSNPARSLSVFTAKVLRDSDTEGVRTEGVRDVTAPYMENFKDWALSPVGILVFFDFIGGKSKWDEASSTVLIPYGQIRHVLRPEYRFG